MKTGEQYWESKEEHWFDAVVVRAARPAFRLARAATRAALDPTEDTFYTQPRVGRGVGLAPEDRLFTLYKFRTMDPETDALSHHLAERFRKLGIDELAQIVNIKNRSMHAVSYRPRILSEHLSLQAQISNPIVRAEHAYLTSHRAPGIASTYGIYHHEHPEPDPNEGDIIAEMEIRDGQQASTKHSLSLLYQLCEAAAARRFN